MTPKKSETYSGYIVWIPVHHPDPEATTYLPHHVEDETELLELLGMIGADSFGADKLKDVVLTREVSFALVVSR